MSHNARERDDEVRAETAAAISRAILAARADDLGDGYTAGARVREQDAAIAREVGGCDPLDEFVPPEHRLAWPDDPDYDRRAFEKSGIEDAAALGLI